MLAKLAPATNTASAIIGSPFNQTKLATIVAPTMARRRIIRR